MSTVHRIIRFKRTLMWENTQAEECCIQKNAQLSTQNNTAQKNTGDNHTHKGRRRSGEINRLVHGEEECKFGGGRPPVCGSRSRDGGSETLPGVVYTVRNLSERHLQRGERVGGRIHGHIVCRRLWVVGGSRFCTAAV